VYSNVNEALPGLMRDLLAYGEKFDSRAGKTAELTFVGITLERPWQREITAPDRKASIAAQIAETMWVLSGRNDVAGLAHYLPRAADFSDDGLTWRAGYGPRLRNYQGVDQLDYVVETLRSNPNSRQAVCTIWDPTVDTSPGKDIACNNWLTFSSRNGELDLMVGIRSNDAMWGWSGINAFEWSVLLEVVAWMIGLAVGKLHFAVTSFHLYDQHWEKAGRISKADPYIYDAFKDSPTFSAVGFSDDMKGFDALAERWFDLERSIRTGQPVNVDSFPEPMLRSWLRVLQWYWTGDETFLIPLEGTRLAQACLVGVKPAGKPQEPKEELEQLDLLKPNMLDHINALHAEKHAAYGDSWKRRGEIGILANIARKVDRIGTGLDTRDETQADTAQDLLVYLAKYRCWLYGLEGNPEDVSKVLAEMPFDTDRAIAFDYDLDRLFNMPAGTSQEKVELVDDMIDQAYSLALSLW
jgi:thymidylate synthase